MDGMITSLLFVVWLSVVVGFLIVCYYFHSDGFDDYLDFDRKEARKPTIIFFFSSRRRHTRYIGDWSSDVCSSDLRQPGAGAQTSRYTQRPPSTSSTLPVRKEACSEARKSVALATSSMVANRPSGTVALNCARSSGESPPMKVGSNGVSAMTGATAQTRMPSGASSAAIDFETRFTAPLEALYQVRPGRGRMP